jgi:8-oxo-dGTP diphosphatase
MESRYTTRITCNESKPGRVWPGVGTGALVVHNGSLLMVLRDSSHGAGTWSVPGGWVEKNEHPFRGAEREVLEETGVEVKAVCEFGWTSAIHPDEDIHAVTLWVICQYVSGVPTVVEPEKCPVVAWVRLGGVDCRPLFTPLEQWWDGNYQRLIEYMKEIAKS